MKNDRWLKDDKGHWGTKREGDDKKDNNIY
jgi:hypothetical protein